MDIPTMQGLNIHDKSYITLQLQSMFMERYKRKFGFCERGRNQKPTVHYDVSYKHIHCNIDWIVDKPQLLAKFYIVCGKAKTFLLHV